jgi:hypothetical protein
MLPGAGAAPQLIRARKILALMIVQQVIERTQGASSKRVGKPTQCRCIGIHYKFGRRERMSTRVPPWLRPLGRRSKSKATPFARFRENKVCSTSDTFFGVTIRTATHIDEFFLITPRNLFYYAGVSDRP